MAKRAIHLLICVHLIFTVGSAVTISAQTTELEPDEETQFRSEVEVSVPLHKRVELIFGGRLRVGHGIAFRERARLEFSLKPSKYFTLAPGYRYQIVQESTGENTQEHRFSFAGTVHLPVKKFTLSDRSLIERRLRRNGNSTRYRNRFEVARPVNLRGIKMELFAFDEVYYNRQARAWVRNRFAIGASKTFSERFTGELYYTRQNDGRSRPGDLHIIGTTLTIRLH